MGGGHAGWLRDRASNQQAAGREGGRERSRREESRGEPRFLVREAFDAHLCVPCFPQRLMRKGRRGSLRTSRVPRAQRVHLPGEGRCGRVLSSERVPCPHARSLRWGGAAGQPVRPAADGHPRPGAVHRDSSLHGSPGAPTAGNLAEGRIPRKAGPGSRSRGGGGVRVLSLLREGSSPRCVCPRLQGHRAGRACRPSDGHSVSPRGRRRTVTHRHQHVFLQRSSWQISSQGLHGAQHSASARHAGRDSPSSAASPAAVTPGLWLCDTD